MHIYGRVIKTLLQRSWLKPSDSVLVLAGGRFDQQVLLDAGLLNVTISNLQPDGGDYAPFQWQNQDAENVRADDASWDWVVIHAGLHHLSVPAKGVAEMLRVARKGIVCFEARDSLLMRWAVRTGLTTDYELEPALLSDGQEGGWRNGPIPNYVYRWTEREFEKVVNSFAPAYRHRFFYEYGYHVPVHRFAMARSGIYRALGSAIGKIARVAEWLLPRQGNQFAFGALKNSHRQAWLTESLRFDPAYMDSKYDKSKYPGQPSAG